MKLIRSLLVLMCTSLAVQLTGCSKPPTQGSITGTVTLDGQALKSGTIRFDAVDNRTPAADAAIIDGKYTATVPPGDKRVTITSPKIVGKRKMYETADSPTLDVTEELLPARYNAQTELKLTVKAGDQEQPFDLKSK